MLPEGFAWSPRGQYAGGELALTLDGTWVAMLMRKANGADWMVRLDCHHGIPAPLVLRQCTGFQAGKAGVEAWAHRHQDRLRAEVATRLRPTPHQA